MSNNQELLLSVFVLIGIIIMLVVIFTFTKPAFRKYRYLLIKKSLDDENKKLIKDKEDLEYLEHILIKYAWYSQNWWVNLTPTYNHRWMKFKKIVKKYKLDIDIMEYPEKKEK